MTGAAVVVGGALSAAASSRASSSAASSARYASDAQAQAAHEELMFAKEQQDRWDEVFGPTQDILAEYYNNLDPDDEAAKNVQNIQKGYQEYQQQLDTTLAQRGMGNSGLGAELTSQMSYQNEMQKAQERSLAPQRVAEQQAGFLGLGMGQAPSIQAGVHQAYGAQQQAYGQAASDFRNQQAQADASFANAIGGIGTGLGYFTQHSAVGNPSGSLNTAPIFGGSY